MLPSITAPMWRCGCKNDDSGDVTNLAVWYQLDKRDDKGEQWLKDMRQWWRRSGRSASMPLDGVSGATQQPGVHSVDLAKVADSLAPEAINYMSRRPAKLVVVSCLKFRFSGR